MIIRARTDAIYHIFARNIYFKVLKNVFWLLRFQTISSTRWLMSFAWVSSAWIRGNSFEKINLFRPNFRNALVKSAIQRTKMTCSVKILPLLMNVRNLKQSFKYVCLFACTRTQISIYVIKLWIIVENVVLIIHFRYTQKFLTRSNA